MIRVLRKLLMVEWDLAPTKITNSLAKTISNHSKLENYATKRLNNRLVLALINQKLPI